jgi:hypothetical protein
MKAIFKKAVLFLVLTLFTVIFAKQASAQTPYISYQVFYDQLSPYGQWVDYPDHGYVWLPDAGSDFYPYSSQGRWVMTDYGWTWLSYYDWGWAPFHYGRWDYDNYYGWYWVPDNIWGPAWVIWRRAPGYYGWTPMGPGMNIGFNYGSYYSNYGNRWIFVNDRYFGRNNINNYYASPNDYNMLLSNSTVINNTYVDNSSHTTYVSGPTRSDVRDVTGRRVSTYEIQENNVPGQSLSNGQLRMYRPQVIKGNDNEQRSAPSVITDRKDVRRSSEINSPSQTENRNSYNNTRLEQQKDAVNQPDFVNQPDAIEKQNAADRQNAVNQQRAIDRQNAVDQQDAVKRQNAVDQQNAVNRQNAVDRQNNVNRQNAADQQDAVNQQKKVNRQNATDRQNAVKRQNDVNQQNIRNNRRILQQQNANTSNERREKSSNTGSTSGNVSTEEAGKSSPRRK